MIFEDMFSFRATVFEGDFLVRYVEQSMNGDEWKTDMPITNR